MFNTSPKLIVLSLVAAVLSALVLATPAVDAAVIYVDLSNGSSADYTVGANTVNVRNGNGTTFDLKDINGVATAFDVTLGGTSGNSPTLGLMPNSGTDAFNLFNGFVNATGVATQTAGTTTVTFTDLDPNLIYDVALLGNRINDANIVANTTFTISDVDASNNISSVVTSATTSAFDTRSNSVVGNIARWDGIAPGLDGDLVVTLSVPASTVGYLNAVRLIIVPEPASILLTLMASLGLVAIMRRARRC